MKDTYATVASKAAYYREHVGTLSNCYDDVIDVRKEDVWTQFTEEGKFLTDHIFYNNKVWCEAVLEMPGHDLP